MNLNLAMLQRLEQSLKNAATKSREKILHDYFDAFMSPAADEHLSFAVPKPGLDTPAAITVLKETFERCGRVARLEYFHELYPALRAVLGSEGFTQTMAAPVMTLVSKNLVTDDVASKNWTQKNLAAFNLRYTSLVHDETMVAKFLRAQALSFGGAGEDTLAWLPGMMDMLEQGELLGAVFLQEGQYIAGAVIQGSHDGELAGVWTLPGYRRRGLAFALCQRLLREYFAEGQTLCWLSAAEDAQTLYEKLGFQWVGTQLNLRFAARMLEEYPQED
ncbi:MAG: GNAT family N-acetyltransferase [Trueperaceae bacterium]